MRNLWRRIRSIRGPRLNRRPDWSVLRQRQVFIPGVPLLILLVMGTAWIAAHTAENAVWARPPVPISEVLNRPDQGEITSAALRGQRMLLMHRQGNPPRSQKAPP